MQLGGTGFHLGRRVGSAGTCCPGPDGAGSSEGGEGQRRHLLSRSAQNEGKVLGEVSTPQPCATVQRCRETHSPWESSPLAAGGVLCLSP